MSWVTCKNFSIHVLVSLRWCTCKTSLMYFEAIGDDLFLPLTTFCFFTCENGFEDVGVSSPLTKQNNDTFQLSAITLSIMNMLS